MPGGGVLTQFPLAFSAGVIWQASSIAVMEPLPVVATSNAWFRSPVTDSPG